MTILKLFNFLKGKRKNDVEFYEYGMTHQEAVIYLLKKTGKALTASEIMASFKGLKLKRNVRSVQSLTSTLFYLKYKDKINYHPLEGKWSA